VPFETKSCRERAKRCWELASQATNPVLKQSLFEMSQRFYQLATKLESTQRLMLMLNSEQETKDAG
jgi:hypothetical protein